MKTIVSLSALAWVLGASLAPAGVISLSDPITDDASTGISTANVYTHAISGGSAQTVNGVDFELLNPTTTPANFTWDTGGLTKNIVTANNGDWIPADGGVTGPGVVPLLQDFTYSGNGANPGSSQTYSLTGLVAGTSYDARLYIRLWDTEGSGRPIDLTFANGTEMDLNENAPEDRPGDILGTGNQQQAYFVNYRYTAQNDSLVITAAVPDTAPANSGSFHLYALTNQVVPEPGVATFLAAGLIGLLWRRRR
jgi:hypothetical protein